MDVYCGKEFYFKNSCDNMCKAKWDGADFQGVNFDYPYHKFSISKNMFESYLNSGSYKLAKFGSEETEEEKQLKHINKLDQQDIEHKLRMIANREAKLEELRKARGSV